MTCLWRAPFRNDIELHLQGDIDSEALLLHYLPEVDLWTGAIVAVEALVRWRHPIWGCCYRMSFLGVAESTNLGGELGRWVMRTALRRFQPVASTTVSGRAPHCASMCRRSTGQPRFRQ